MKTMRILRRIYLLLIFAVCSVPAIAQDTEPHNSSFFIAPLAEIIGYGRHYPAIGGGLAIGGGDGVSIGARCLYSATSEGLNSVELAVFMRFYPDGPEARTGLFIQLNVGAVMYAHDNGAYFPALSGDLSAGIAVGWRFPLGARLYLEPAIRAGYPYKTGAGIAAVFRL